MAHEDPPRHRDVHDALERGGHRPRSDRVAGSVRQAADPRDPDADADEMDFGETHTPTGATSTSEPPHETDIEVDPRKANPHELSRRERRRAGG